MKLIIFSVLMMISLSACSDPMSERQCTQEESARVAQMTSECVKKDNAYYTTCYEEAVLSICNTRVYNTKPEKYSDISGISGY